MNIALFGPTGRTGSEIVKAVQRRQAQGEQIRIVSGIVGPNSSDRGTRLAGIDTPLIAASDELPDTVEVIIDFSTPAGAKAALELCTHRRLPGVLCTTAVGEELENHIRRAGELLPLVRATNTSVAVAALIRLAEVATRLLGPDFDVELFELHHRGKKDAPSGTALTVLEHVAQERGVALRSVLAAGRVGEDALRQAGELGAQALRGGDAAGEHTLYFLGQGERIEISQRATHRGVYADGAIRAARWLTTAGRAPACYSMLDVLERP